MALDKRNLYRFPPANIDKVHGLVFITYRTATTDVNVARDYADRELDFSQLSYIRPSFDEKFVTAPEVHQIIQDTCPEYEPSGYLGITS